MTNSTARKIKEEEKKMEQERASENRDNLREILKHSEIKRISERLTKKELCNIYLLNYNFYMNCLSGRNVPSKKMDVAMREYLETPTAEIYEMVFAFREKETEYHPNLAISEEEADKYAQELKNSKVLTEPTV